MSMPNDWIYLTYEELKPVTGCATSSGPLRIYLTYEELKLGPESYTNKDGRTDLSYL